MNEIFFSPIMEDAEIIRLSESVGQGLSPCAVFGMSDSQKAHLASAVSSGRPILFITWSNERAERAAEDMETYLGRETAVLPAREAIPGVRTGSSQSAMERAEVIYRLLEGTDVLAAGIDALLYNFMPSALWRSAAVKLDHASRISPALLRTRCLNMGYQEAEAVEKPGQISFRGGIADIFPAGWDNPLRIEFFDDEIDSLRLLDAASQRSVKRLESAVISPAGELYVRDLKKGADMLRAQLAAYEKKARRNNPEGADQAQNLFQPVIDALDSGSFVPDGDLFPYFYTDYTCILDFLPENVLVVLDEPRRIRERADNAAMEYSEIFKEQLVKGRVLPFHAEYLRPYDQLLAKLKEKTLLSMQSITAACRDISPQAVFTLSARSMQSFQNSPSLLAKELTGLRVNKFRTLICAGGESKARRLVNELESLNVYAQYTSDLSLKAAPGEIFVLPCRVSRGFEYTEARMSLISEGDIFSASRSRRGIRRAKRRDGANIADVMELKIGDYVVHDNYGIGIYKGITKIKTDGVFRDYITIAYQGTDKLYVPAEQLKLVQKYMGGEDAVPKINKLGSKEWAGAKTRAKKAIKDMTDELIALYSKREAAQGYAFSPDTPFQRNFEDDFPFTETPDQLRAIDEIKRDMESGRVMDRLLCGDVGYGKTEVAMRAAFKAVMDGKQVAFLSPTTILAQQHYNTMAARMLPYGVRLDVLSRFRSPKERKQVLSGLKEGKIDIVSGTHALLAKDVSFKDLGLLIVDEEQRFGVAHKERIKQLKSSIDVLTLTATPIPRTLHMSLVGVRDMSVIDSPPEERYPVQTYVAEYSRTMIRDAVMRELGRGGQVYFVYNRIQGIETFAQSLKELIPEARIGIGHGQMAEGELEKVMMEFYDGAFDVFLCTAIIENGLDIPRVNTIIVYDADKFGLSQLYQLKGRVGRSNRIAYAYFTFRPGSVLTETAEKRLNALREFTDMGSGFKIALRDLEIRGAGNMLGGEQHGHIAQIGYELYCRLVKEAVSEGMEQPEKRPETIVEIKTDAYISEDYIRSEAQKVNVYKRIAAIEEDGDREDILEELIDRYGDPPQCVVNLINIAYMKALASRAGITHIIQRPDAIIMRFGVSSGVDFERLTRALEVIKKRASVSAGDKLAVIYRTLGVDTADAVAQIIKFLKSASGEEEEEQDKARK